MLCWSPIDNWMVHGMYTYVAVLTGNVTPHYWDLVINDHVNLVGYMLTETKCLNVANG